MGTSRRDWREDVAEPDILVLAYDLVQIGFTYRLTLEIIGLVPNGEKPPRVYDLLGMPEAQEILRRC